MTTLTITKAYSSGNILTEAHIDNFRSGLLTLFNTSKLSSGNFNAAMNLPATKFTTSGITTADNTYITFGGSSNATFGLDSSKNWVFNTSSAATNLCFYATSIYYLDFYSNKLYAPGDIIIGEGGADRTVLQALSTYKKPVIEYRSATQVSIQGNSGTTNETVLYFPTFVAAVTEDATTGTPKYRRATISVTANGYSASHTGAAQGGLRSGVSLTTNSWYAVYAVKLQGGSDYSATTAKFILVFDTTLPTAANESTLNTNYGAQNWLYLGLVRYGFGATGSSSSIIKFKYSNKGWCHFCECSTSGYAGLNLSYSTTSADGAPEHTLAAGMSGQVIPSTVGHITLSLNRENVSDWTIKDTSTNVIFQGGYQSMSTSFPHGFVVTLPFDSTAYTIHQTRKGTSAVARAVTLRAFCDPYILSRRHGHGV